MARERSTTSNGSDKPGKPCAACGRWIEWRKKWERDWENVKFCGDACRKHKLTDVDTALESAIIALLAARAKGATICPSEAARSVALDHVLCQRHKIASWEELMEPARKAARRLVAGNRVVITQGGREVDPSTARGPIRIRAT